MALITNQNLYSLSSQHYLGINQTALGKSIERLSSGLRINHAADDASGMAISEKMRGQISGLKRASMNAQDGISYLQTAEGAMEQTSSILQRMRELAVQSSNGIYTTNDRAEIQKEVDQLKAELNRVSTSTEFNARKLINGDATGIWSSDTNLVEAIMRGPVREGNYELSMSVRPGVNQIMKTDIMTLNNNAIGAEIDIRTTPNTTNVGAVKDPISMPPTGTANFTVSITGANGLLTAAASANLVGTYSKTSSSWAATAVAVPAAPGTVSDSGYMEIEVLQDTNNLSTLQYRTRFISAKDGSIGDWQTFNNTSLTDINVAYTGNGKTIDADVAVTIGGNMQKGDKILIAVNEPIAANAIASGGGTIQITGGPGAANGPVVVYSGANELTNPDNGDTILDKNSVVVNYASMDEKTGNLNIGSVTLDFKENSGIAPGSGAVVPGSFEMNIQGGGKAATTTTKLKDIKVFTDGDGNNIFDNKQELTIYGNGTKTVVHIEGNDTISTLVEKLNKAIVTDLQMGSDDPSVNSNLVRYISVPDNAGWGTIKGTMLIQTALTGKNSELSFVGNQALIDAFSLAEVQKPRDNETTVTVRDAHTGDLLGTEVTGNDRVQTLIPGVEIALDSRAGVDSSWDPARNEVVFASNPNLANDRYFLHIVDNRTSLQIGANKGQDLDVSIPQLDLKGLGLENTTMVSQELSRRAIGDIDEALTRVVSARATVGAQVSRLEHTIANLSTAKQNLVTAESRIRDLDVAEESTTFARNQILVQSGVAMLAQANQLPQMALQLIKG